MRLGIKAQTATEFAVLGTLIIVAFAFLINYSEKLNRQQSYIMQTFRATLKTARNATTANGGVGNSASYTKVVFRRMPNVSNPMELGQMQSFSNSSNVLWSRGDKIDEYGYQLEEKGVSKYQLNEGNEIDVTERPEDKQPDVGVTETNTSTFQNTVDTSLPTNTFVKQENGSTIITTKTLHASDQLQANIPIGYDTTTNSVHYEPITQTLGTGGKYYPQTTTLDRSRDMQ